MEHTRIIISDLHVGMKDKFDIFASDDKPQLFESFIQHLRDLQKPIELIINGDFVDFLQLQPWNDLRRGSALTKVGSIVEKSAYFFDELGKLLQDSQNQVVMLPGNHDVELAYPEVGKVVRNAILKTAPGAANRIRMFDTPDMRRTSYIPKINGVVVRIEHGNEGDPWNSLNYNALFTDAETSANNFSYPPGTKLVYETMNEFKDLFRFVDLLKPEMPAVPLLLIALKPFMSVRKVPEASLIAIERLGNAAITALRRAVLGGAPLGDEKEATSPTVDDQLIEFLADELPEDRVSDWSVEQFLHAEETDEGTLGGSFQRVRLWFVSWAVRGLARFQAKQRGAQFYLDDHPKNTAAKGAKTRFEGDVKVVVFGHTHEALKTEFDDRVYVNSGTWANLIELPTDTGSDMLKWLQDLADDKFEKTAFPTFVQFEPADQGVDVSLNSWSLKGANTLWTKNISR